MNYVGENTLPTQAFTKTRCFNMFFFDINENYNIVERDTRRVMTSTNNYCLCF